MGIDLRQRLDEDNQGVQWTSVRERTFEMKVKPFIGDIARMRSAPMVVTKRQTKTDEISAELKARILPSTRC